MAGFLTTSKKDITVKKVEKRIQWLLLAAISWFELKVAGDPIFQIFPVANDEN